jgi:hypothetical protein
MIDRRIVAVSSALALAFTRRHASDGHTAEARQSPAFEPVLAGARELS